MIIDFRSTQTPGFFETGVCIVGGGAAGIAIGMVLAKARVDCCIVESGGLEFDERVNRLCAVESSGVGQHGGCCERMLGGATNHWGGLCTELNEIDFAARKWVPNSGWPIEFTEMSGFYARAAETTGLQGESEDLFRRASAKMSTLPFLDSKIVSRLYRFVEQPRSFADRHQQVLRHDGHLTVIVHCNFRRFVTNPDASSVQAAEVTTLDGRLGRVSAKAFVLAGGAIENARILLTHDLPRHPGLGNENGNVGRYFMQHPHVAEVAMALSRPKSVMQRFDRYFSKGHRLQISIGPSAAAQRSHKIGNCSATVHAPIPEASGAAALREIQRSVAAGEMPNQLFAKLRTVLSDVPAIADRVVSGPRLAWLTLRAEQIPRRESRVELSSHVDRLDRPMARLHWDLDQLDRRTLRMSALLIAEEFGRLGWGRLRLPLWLLDNEQDWPNDLWGGCHRMGTTRMSADPRHGVVDGNCRVHSVANLYIAGSSVFPTSGYANPTLSLVALAIRLADRLVQTCRPG